MAGMGFEGAYGAQGTLKGVQDWINERRRAKQFEQDNLLFEQQQDDRRRMLEQEGEARAQDVAARDQRGELIKAIDELDLPPLAKLGAKISIQKGKELPPQLYEMLKAKQPPKPERVETVDAQGRPVTRFVNPEAGVELPQYVKPEAPTKPDYRIAPNGQVVDMNDPANLSRNFAPPREGSKPNLHIAPSGEVIDMNNPANIGRTFERSRVSQQGRGVLSGDANRLAEMDLGADMLKTLRTDLPSGSTGFAPGLAARVPNILSGPVEAATGGMLSVVDAKKRLATQKLVKQIIGKALEGGVLREHDEQKYEHIIPTLDDTDDVVKSKLNTLDTMIQQKRELTLDSLGASGFDVSRFDRTVGAMGPQQPAPGRPAPAGGGGNRIRYDKQGNRVP